LNGPPINPYAPPISDAEPAPSGVEGAAFARPLFSPRQMGWAAFFGSVLAGVLLLQANYRAMGRTAAANKTLVLGTLVPKGVPTPINLAIAWLFYKIAEGLQGDAFFAHMAARGQRRSNWIVFGLIIATFVALVVLVFAVLFAFGALDGLD
jgi:hypothetical protein